VRWAYTVAWPPFFVRRCPKHPGFGLGSSFQGQALLCVVGAEYLLNFFFAQDPVKCTAIRADLVVIH